MENFSHTIYQDNNLSLKIASLTPLSILLTLTEIGEGGERIKYQLRVLVVHYNFERVGHLIDNIQHIVCWIIFRRGSQPEDGPYEVGQNTIAL